MTRRADVPTSKRAVDAVQPAAPPAPTSKPSPARGPREERGYLTDATLDYLRKHFRGWDFHALHVEFRGWLAESEEREPERYQSAFIGFVKRYHEKNRHQLRG